MDNEDPLSRRLMLAMLGTCGGASLAGCNLFTNQSDDYDVDGYGVAGYGSGPYGDPTPA